MWEYPKFYFFSFGVMVFGIIYQNFDSFIGAIIAISGLIFLLCWLFLALDKVEDNNQESIKKTEEKR